MKNGSPHALESRPDLAPGLNPAQAEKIIAERMALLAGLLVVIAVAAHGFVPPGALGGPARVCTHAAEVRPPARVACPAMGAGQKKKPKKRGAAPSTKDTDSDPTGAVLGGVAVTGAAATLGDGIESSLHAIVPLAHAERLRRSHADAMPAADRMPWPSTRRTRRAARS